MAKKSQGLKKKQPTDHVKIDRLRKQIDHLDHKLLKLLAMRMKMAQEIARLKKKTSMPVYQKSRWQSLMEDRLAVGEKKFRLDAKFTRKIFLSIHSESVRVQRKITTEKDGS